MYNYSKIKLFFEITYIIILLKGVDKTVTKYNHKIYEIKIEIDVCFFAHYFECLKNKHNFCKFCLQLCIYVY